MKKILSIGLLAILFAVNIGYVTPVQAETEASGLEFSTDVTYRTEKPYSEEILTYEATLCFSKDFSGEGGVILGNYVSSTYGCYNFQIGETGQPILYLDEGLSTSIEYEFNEICVYTGKWTHVAIVKDKEQGKVICYIDGEAKQTLDMKSSDKKEIIPEAVASVGDDLSGKGKTFKGQLLELKLYSDVRTAKEIIADTNKLDKDGLVAAYAFSSGEENTSNITDLSKNGYDMQVTVIWTDVEPELEPYDFSIAVIGDTQIVSRHHSAGMVKIYDYIVDNIEKFNTKFVVGLGDITDGDVDEEWNVAYDQIHRMDSLVAYNINRGNHDSSEQINKYFPYGDYSDVLGGSYDEKIENTWQILTVGDLKYLILTLDYGPSDEILEWASEVIEEHSDHQVIITTHAYLCNDGTTLDSSDACAASRGGGINDGDEMWEKLVSQHKNIIMVLSGHDPSDNVLVNQAEGIHGNMVTQMLINPQDVDEKVENGAGLVAMFYFSEDGKKVQVRYYSTIHEKWFMSTSQFTINLDGNEAAETNAPSSMDPLYVIAPVVVVVIAAVGIVIYRKKQRHEG